MPSKQSVLNKCLKEERRQEGAHSGLQTGGHQASHQAARLQPVGTGSCNIWGLSQMRTAQNARIRLIRACFPLCWLPGSFLVCPALAQERSLPSKGKGRTGRGPVEPPEFRALAHWICQTPKLADASRAKPSCCVLAGTHQPT